MSYIDLYKDVSVSAEVMGSTPAQEIKLLLEKLDKNIADSIQAINNNDIPTKCKRLTNANDIVMYLFDCLNMSAGGEIAKKLNTSYKTLEDLIFSANAKNDINLLNEAKKITDNLCHWWDKVNA